MVQNTAVNSDGRRLQLDALRGVAVLLMIAQHLLAWLWRGPKLGETQFDYPLLTLINALGGLAAPLFIILAGVGCSLMVESGRRSSLQLDGLLIKRGLMMALFAYGLSLLTPSWFSWRSWFVLHLIAAALLLSPLLRRLPNYALLLLLLILLILTPLLQAYMDTPWRLSNGRMAGWQQLPGSAVLPGGHLRMALLEGHYPLLPWLSFYIAGYYLAREHRQLSRLAVLSLTATTLLALLLVGAVLGDWFSPRIYRLNSPFFPATPAVAVSLMVLLLPLAGLGLRAGAVSWWWRLRQSSALVVLGRASLTLLLLHVLLFREGSHYLDYYHRLQGGLVLAITIAFVLAAVLLAQRWQRYQYRYGAEWLLRRASRVSHYKKEVKA